MKAQDHLPEMMSALARTWGMEFDGDTDWTGLVAALEEMLSELLTRDFERLVQAMYRLDVEEDKFAAAIACASVKERAAALGKVVLERELKRLEFRMKYQARGNEQT